MVPDVVVAPHTVGQPLKETAGVLELEAGKGIVNVVQVLSLLGLAGRRKLGINSALMMCLEYH